MKKLYTLLVVIFLGIGLNAQLAVGDIAFVQYNADGPEIIKFIAFAPIPSGEVIFFTDNGWLNTGVFRTGEGVHTWNSPGVACGDIVTVDLSGPALSGGGDQLIAYQGTLGSPTIITALNSEGAGVWQANATNTNTSALPSGLVDGVTAVALNEIDNAMYTGPTLSGTIAVMQAAIYDNSNWSGGNATADVQDFTATITLTDCSVPTGPSLSISPSTISGLDYVELLGPSAIDSFVVTATSLTGPVTMTAGTDFEISLDNTAYGVPPAGVLIVADTALKVYVRLKAVLGVNTYSEAITFSTPVAVIASITFSGEVTAAPVVCIPTLQTLPYAGIAGSAGFDHSTSGTPPLPPAAPAEECGTNFLLSYTSAPSSDGSDNEFGNQSNLGLNGLSSADFGGEASFQTYPVDVSGVTAVNINADGITNGTGTFNTGNEGFAWWYSLDGGVTIDTFFQTMSDGSLDANVTNLDVTGVNEIIVGFIFEINGGGAGFNSMNVEITEYAANPPTITIGSTSMSGFAVVAGAGASASQGNTLEWANLTGSVTSDNTVNSFEFSIDAGVSWNPATILNILIPPFPGTSVSATPVLVRLIAGLGVGNYFDTIVLSSTGAADVEVFLEGTVNPALLAACSELFFSEYIEGSGSNKCLEIYNPTATDIDMAAGTYAVAIYGNGNTIPNGGAAIALGGVVPAYGTYVICNSSSDPGFQALADSVGGAFNAMTFYNGDDAVALQKAGVNIDVIGEIGVDPGAGWSNGGVATNNQTLVRMATVLAGDNIGGGAFDPSTEWTSLPQNDFSNLGQHNSDCSPFVWTGITSTDYHTGSNWTKGVVPGPVDNAWIPASPFGNLFPIASTDVDINDLMVRPGASLNIAPTFGLTLWTGTVTNNGSIVLESNASGTAWLDDFTVGGTYTGDITVQTFITTGSVLGQRYFGSPVVAGSVVGLDGTYAGVYPLGPITPLPTCDPTILAAGSAYSNILQWNEDATFGIPCVQEGWEAISDAGPLTPGRGYSGWVNDGSIISVTGAPNTGDVPFATSGASFAPGPGYVAGATGWHVLSNPFPSPLDVDAVINSGFSSVQTYDGSGGPYSGTFFSTLLSTDVLPVMQGFVAESFNTGGETYTATQALRTSGNAIWQRPDFGHMLIVDVAGNSHADKTHVYFQFDATDSFDPYGDCRKRESDAGHPTLFTNMNGDRMSLNGMSSNNMTRSIDLGLLSGSNGTFELSFDGLASFPTTSLIFLEDKFTGDFVNVREVSTYSFTTNVSDDADRFVIHFTAPIEVTTTSATCAGADAELAIDFGQNVINNNAINWDFSLESNTAIVEEAIAQNGVTNLANLETGAYNLVLQNGAYTIEILVEIDGAEVVTADFEDPIAVEEGTLVNLANLSTGAVDYTWSLEGLEYNNTDLSHVFTLVGQNEIVLSASNEDCVEDMIKTIEVYAKATGINDAPALEAANVYAQSNIIVIDLTGVVNADEYAARIFNLLGQEVYQGELTSSITKIEIKESGNYFFVQVVKGETQKVFKVVIK
ncbi:MAG: hypothetical protein ACI9O4_000173 [Chitinophagales bacterium]|jgi:hypothetical protein